jgi:hypothetical protein
MTRIKNRDRKTLNHKVEKPIFISVRGPLIHAPDKTMKAEAFYPPFASVVSPG